MYAVTLTNNGNLAAGGGGDKEVHVWDIQRKTCIAQFRAHTAEIKIALRSVPITNLISAAGDPPSATFTYALARPGYRDSKDLGFAVNDTLHSLID